MFNLRQEDRGKVLIMGSVFFLAGVSEMLNYTSFMAIFNSRAGTEYLPLMYMIEAFVLPIVWSKSVLVRPEGATNVFVTGAFDMYDYLNMGVA